MYQKTVFLVYDFSVIISKNILHYNDFKISNTKIKKNHIDFEIIIIKKNN